MKPARNYLIVLVTAPDLKTARRLAQAALRRQLVACVNLLPGIESHYWWQGKLECGQEIMMVLKTTRPRLAALERLILARHPYDTPEFLVSPVTAGNARYLAWLAASTSGTPEAVRKSPDKKIRGGRANNT